MSNIQILETNRLSLRPFAAGDEAFVVRLLNEQAFLRFIGDKGVRNRDDAVRYLREGPLASYEQYGFGLLLVASREFDAPVGMCGLIRRADQQHPDIGYAFLSEFGGRGYALEAASAVLQHAHRDLAIETVLAFVNPDNARSIRLLEKLGMHPCGTSRLDGIELPQATYSTVGPT